MNRNRKGRKLWALVLALALCISSMSIGAFATPTITKENTAVLSLDFLGKCADGNKATNKPADTAQAIPDYADMNVGDVLWFGLAVDNMTGTAWPVLQNYGVGGLVVGVNYDNTILEPYNGKDYGGIGAARFTNATNAYTIVAGDANTTTGWAGDAYSLTTLAGEVSTVKAEKSDITPANAKTMQMTVALPDECAGYLEYQRFYQNTDPAKQYLLRFPMTLKAKPDETTGATAIELALTGDLLVATVFADDGQQQDSLCIQWDATEGITPTTNAKTYFSYAGDPALFPKQETKPTLSGKPTIDGTTTAGQTLTAKTDGLALSDSTTITDAMLSYVWKADGTAIEGATGKTFALTGAQIGKKITVEVTCSAADAATKTAASVETAAVAAAALPTGFALSDATPTFGDTLTVTGLPTGWSLAWTYGAAADSADTAWTTQASAPLIYQLVGGKFIKATATAPAGSIYGDGAKVTAVTTAAVAKKTLTDPDTPTLSTKVGVTSIAGGNLTPKGGATGSGAYTAPTVAYTVSNVTGVDTADTPGSATVTIAAIPDTDPCYIYAGKTINDVPVTVTDKTLTGIAIKAEPTLAALEVGDTIDLTGIEFTVTYDTGSEDMTLAQFVAAGGTFKIGGTAVVSGTTAATLAMNGQAITADLNGKTATTTTTLAVSEAADEITAITAVEGIEDSYMVGDTLNLLYVHATVTWTQAGSQKVNLAALKAQGFKFYLSDDGTTLGDALEDETELTAAHNGKHIVLANGDGSIKFDAGTLTVNKEGAAAAWENLKQRVGSIAQVTAKIGNYDLTDLIQYQLPETTTPGTPGTDAVACDVADCVHADGSECTAKAAVAEVPCDKTVACNHGDYKAADCPIAAAVEAGTYTDIDAAIAAGVTCDKTVACDHNTHKAADCTYVAAQPAVTCTEAGCVHADASECTAKAAVPGTPDTTTPAEWVKWADRADDIKALTAGNYNLKIDKDEINALTGFTDDYDALTEDLTNTLAITKKSSGGGGGGGVSSDFTVRFNAGANGSFAAGVKSSISVKKDASLSASDVPTATAKEGFRFIGWSLDGKTVVDPTEAKVTSNMTYTALYRESKGTHTAYMNGYTDGTFRPENNITRAEAAAMLARLIEDYDADSTYTGSMEDVADTDWFANEVFFNVEKGYITGYTDGSFRPANNITRQEFCTIVAKYLGYDNEGTSDFEDCHDAWAEGYIAHMVEAGMITGYSDGTFRPDAYITRAEATKILNAVFERVPDKDMIDEIISEYDVDLEDVSSSYWAYYEILEAAIEHEIADFHE